MNEILMYQTADNQTEIEVQFEKDTVWLTQKQIAIIFGIQRPAITKHLKNIFLSGELDETSVCSILEHTAKDGKIYKTTFYNLDAILSVGYRINSKQATQFRQWATQRLKDYLVQGYSLNEKRLHQLSENMRHLEQAVKLIQASGTDDTLNVSEAKGLLEILSHYTQSFILLNQYDSHSLQMQNLNENITYQIRYEEATKLFQVRESLINKHLCNAIR